MARSVKGGIAMLPQKPKPQNGKGEDEDRSKTSLDNCDQTTAEFATMKPAAARALNKNTPFLS